MTYSSSQHFSNFICGTSGTQTYDIDIWLLLTGTSYIYLLAIPP